MGTCSGFPLCCIVWFVTGWKLGFKVKRFRFWYLRKTGWGGYVPCPLCTISGARVSVRRCDSECGHVEESHRMILERHPDAKFH
jgi:hypothetical protein